MRLHGACIMTLAAASVATAAFGAEPGATRYGKFELQWRLRAEAVDDAALARDSNATTLRTRVAWSSPARAGWQAAIELDDVRALDRDAYFSTVDGPPDRPVIADPVGTNLNRAVLEYKRRDFDLALGRQRLTLDDQRFVGNVGWRQNEQTYDGAALRWRPLAKTELTLAWIGNVNRIYVGQVLYIPCSGSTTSGSVGYIILTYTPSPTSAVIYNYNYLTPYQRVEENLKTNEYDIWRNEVYNETVAVAYPNIAQKQYTECNQCQSVAMSLASNEVVKAATLSEEGRGANHYECKACGHHRQVDYTIPRQKERQTVYVYDSSSSSSNSSGSWGSSSDSSSSSSDSSFGGGDSGGGGSGSDW